MVSLGKVTTAEGAEQGRVVGCWRQMGQLFELGAGLARWDLVRVRAYKGCPSGMQPCRW